MLNVVVDPYGVFTVFEIASLESFREGATSRVGKAEKATRSRYDVLIFGDSRFEFGLNPDSPSLASWGMGHNLSVSGCTVSEGARFIELAASSHPPKLLIWGFDPENFGELNDPISVPESLESRLNASLNPRTYYSRHLIGLSTTHQSLRTLCRWIATSGRPPRPTGQSEGRPQSFSLTEPGLTRFLENYVRGFFGWKKVVPAGPESVASLSIRLRRLRDQGVRVVLVFPPKHALLQLIESQDRKRSETAEENIRAIVAVVDSLNEEGTAAAGSIDCWSFRGFTSHHVDPVAEQVPAPFRWFNEPLHMSSRLGEVILERILTPSAANDVDGFGVRLTQENVVAHLQALRQARDRYIATAGPQLDPLIAAERRISERSEFPRTYEPLSTERLAGRDPTRRSSNERQ